MNILPLSTQPVMVRHWVDIHSKTKSSLLLPTKGAEGVINVCSYQFGKSGLPETWIPPPPAPAPPPPAHYFRCLGECCNAGLL